MDEENTEQKKWDALATVKTFDLGVTPEESHLIPIPPGIEIINTGLTTPISLLVQSLVQQLCSLLERDKVRSEQLYNVICEKLHSMNLIDDSYSMGEFEAMRSLYQNALHQLVTVTSGAENPIQLPATFPIVQPLGLEWSRYHRDFEELYFIAAGGFGSVFKAKHRLDGVEYAVKKVYIESADISSVLSHLAEVKTLASLNHPNIVNYKAAWLEPMIQPESDMRRRKYEEMESGSISSYNSVKSSVVYSNTNIIKSFKTHNSKELTTYQSQSDFVISFKNSSSLEDDCPREKSESGNDTKTTSKENAVCKLKANELSSVNLKWATLYIQMSFCQQTLKQWLDERNRRIVATRKGSADFTLNHSDSTESANLNVSDSSGNFPVSWTPLDVLIDMFTQLVHGLHYIHSRGIIHHDIKPSNVFVATSENKVQVQLGDFGLACPLQQSHSGLALGTQLYAAPEQLEGECDPKSDLYSLGIILFEMIEPFDTEMERVKTITNLKKGQIPACLTANYPKLAHIIGKLIRRKPVKRFDTTQLLEELKNLSENKDDTIRTLKEELAARDDEINRLRIMLAKFNTQSQ